MQLTFFGTDEDVAQIWHWLLETPGIVICEDYSRPDMPNRWFQNGSELPRLSDETKPSLAAWSPEFGVAPWAETVQFNERTQKRSGTSGRTILNCPSFIKVGRNNEQMGCLANGSVACWNEKGARQRSVFSEEILDSVNWEVLSRTCSRIIRRIRTASPAKLRSYPIMPDAWGRFRAGEIKLWNWGTVCEFPSDLISQ